MNLPVEKVFIVNKRVVGAELEYQLMRASLVIHVGSSDRTYRVVPLPHKKYTFIQVTFLNIFNIQIPNSFNFYFLFQMQKKSIRRFF